MSTCTFIGSAQMILNKIKSFRRQSYDKKYLRLFVRNATVGFTDNQQKKFSAELKLDIERHWRDKLVKHKFDPTKTDEKFYVLSMFPYPSGNLHMGHVRVYAMSDAIARFYRMNGKNVLHPMGWDAFGLPAENAANQRNISAAEWTKQNIAYMKEQLINLGCSFDWCRELATCNPSYYKWTQSLFLKLHKAGMVYQKEALVNWDPIDKTVLANEQVDQNGYAWRSGAKVEKKSLRQWFIKATVFSKPLWDGLNDPILVDWKDVINVQRHWIGECDGFRFDLTADNGKTVTVWTKTPEHFESAAFIAINSDNVINADKISQGHLNVQVENPFTGTFLPVIVTNEVEYPPGCDTYLGLPTVVEFDKEFAVRNKILVPDHITLGDLDEQRRKILSKAKNLNIGGYAVSSKLKDWLISRQRKWGTPIPIIHCDVCGAVPVNESNLPLVHSMTHSSDLTTTCPNCNNPNAHHERDTMDTFVDSSWYFLRYLDPKNDSEMFDKSLGKFLPVDIYIGGMEHAVLHLYYARFVNYFLHSIGLVPEPEPFKRLLVQGMVKGLSFCVKSTGKYLKESEVKIVDAKTNQAEELSTGKPVDMRWEKMSKSKFNGVDPAEAIAKHSCDTVRLIMLGVASPRSDTNWPTKTFLGILNWQRRLWTVVNDFQQIRADNTISNEITNVESFAKKETEMFETRNLRLNKIIFNFKFSHSFQSAVTNMQLLTKSIRGVPKEVVKYGGQYERALAALIIMLSPMAPHYASELWSQFLRAPHRINSSSNDINWELDVLEQRWPKVDATYALDLEFKVNGIDLGVSKFTQDKLKEIDFDEAMKYALQNQKVIQFVADRKIVRSHYDYYPECKAVLNLFLEEPKKVIDAVEQ